MLVFVGAFLTVSTAQAQQRLSFGEPLSSKEQKIISFVRKNVQDPDNKYVLSKIDLNNDSLDEYVVRAQSCTSKTLCRHDIIALLENKPLLLLSAQARQIIIENNHHFGVQDITLYDNTMNDFQKSNYAWNPHTYLYEQKDH
jgi:hypothetical protein